MSPSVAGSVGHRGIFPSKAAGDRAGIRRSTRWILIGILALGLLLRLLHFWAITGTAFPKFGFVLTQSDMYANWQWAQTILAGDWLGREIYHPYFEWMKRIAPLETWYRWWGGKEIFQQAPLYPYLLAGLLMVSRGSVTWVLLVQLVIGALQPLVVYRLAARLFDARVGLAGAALTALYGPFIFHQGVLLRDWLPPLLEPLALLALLRARDNTRGWMWPVSGAALGLALLAKETILVFLPAVFLWILLDQRWAWRQAGRAGIWVLVGLLLSLSPLLFRNVAVGAPVFALSNRAAEGIIEGNAADGFPVGLVHPPSMRGILESSQGHLRGVIQGTLNTYHGDIIRFFKVQFMKLRGLVDPFEVPNNVALSYGVELSPVLRGTLGYGTIFPLGLAGFLLSLRAWRRHVLVAVYGLTMVGGLMAVPILARYRLVLVPVLLLYAAVLLVSLSDALRERNAHRVIGTLGLMLAASLVQHVIVPLDERTKDRVHTPDYLGAARVYAEDNQFDRAANEMRRLLDKAQRSPRHVESMPLFETDYRVFLARSLIAQDEWEEAKGQIDLAIAAHTRAREPVSYPYLNFGALYLKMGESAKAKTFLVRFLELEPEGPLAEKVRRVLARLEDPS
jgi:hypothetical protein